MKWAAALTSNALHLLQLSFCRPHSRASLIYGALTCGLRPRLYADACFAGYFDLACFAGYFDLACFGGYFDCLLRRLCRQRPLLMRSAVEKGF